jgi:hypothetical protein
VSQAAEVASSKALREKLLFRKARLLLFLNPHSDNHEVLTILRNLTPGLPTAASLLSALERGSTQADADPDLFIKTKRRVSTLPKYRVGRQPLNE